jgi:hypothetical protein
MSELAGGFSRRSVAWMAGIAAASFAAAILLQAYGGDLSDRPTAGSNTFSYSALGYHGLMELLSTEKLGVTARQTRGGAGPGPGRPLVLAEPDLSSPEEKKHLAAFALEARERQAPLVVVLPKWHGRPRKNPPGWVADATLLPEYQIEAVLAALDLPALKSATVERRPPRPAEGLTACEAPGGGPFAIAVRHLQLLTPGEGLAAEVECSGGGLLIARGSLGPGDPDFFLVADPDLWNNQGLAWADHVALANRLFLDRLSAKGVVFDETIHGFLKSRGLLAEAFRFPLLPGVLQGVLFLGIVLAAGMGRFGAPLPSATGLAAGKEVLIDNTSQLLASGGRTGGRTAESLNRYYHQTVRAVAARFFLPLDLPEEELAARLQEIGKRRGAMLDLTALKLRIAALDPGGRGDRRAAPRAAAIAGIAGIAGIALRLYRWRMEMTDGH